MNPYWQVFEGKGIEQQDFQLENLGRRTTRGLGTHGEANRCVYFSMKKRRKLRRLLYSKVTDLRVWEMMCMVKKKVPSIEKSPCHEKQYLGISVAM